MALTLTRKILDHPSFIRKYFLGFLVTSATHKTVLASNSFGSVRVSDAYCEYFRFLSPQCFCTTNVQPEKLCWEGSSCEVLLRKLEFALKNHNVDEAWSTFNDLKRLYGFHEDSHVSRLISALSYSSEPHWLKKACDLVFIIQNEKLDLVQPDILNKLSLSLARARMPIPASMIIRLMLKKENLPNVEVLRLVFLHMVKTEIGTCIASNLLIQICDCFLQSSPEKNECSKLIRPDTMIFNLVLYACVRFGSSLKGQYIMELMSQTGVIADAHSIILMAQIHEMNGQRDELKKFKNHVDQVSVPFLQHYRSFYDSLLSLYFMFDDIDAASELVLNLNRHRSSFPDQKIMKGFQKPCLVPIGSPNLRNRLNIKIMPELLEKDSIIEVEGKKELILLRNGKLLLSNRALAKLVNGYKKYGKISELSQLLLSIQMEYHLFGEYNLCSDVIDAFIQLGLLDTAHDMLDDMESAGYPMGRATYMSLLTAYYKSQMFKEAEVLLKQMRKAGLALNLADEMVVSACHSEVEHKNAPYTNATGLIGKSDLTKSLIREMGVKEKLIPSIVYELNSSIYFFCKGKMIGDALKIYRKMQEMKIQPTVQTFIYLVYGYSSLKKYRDITILWGDIKRTVRSGALVLNRDLYEILLLNFLQGGYFERVMEIIDYMKKHNMYIDKGMYKNEFLKHHKDLYRSLKASKARTEAQSKRLENVLAFRKWVGID